jgi:hypothetical protein
MQTGNIWMKFGFVGIVVLGLIGGSASNALADIEATVSVEFLDDMNSVITEIDPGDPFWMRVSVDGPAAGLSQGYIDVTVSHSSAEFTFDKNIWELYRDDEHINPLLPFMRWRPTNNPWNNLQDSEPQFSNCGGQTASGLSGFAANGDWWFKSLCSGISTPGTLTADTGQGEDSMLFKVYTGPQSPSLPLPREEINFGSGQLIITPEPTTMSLLAMGGLAFLNRRKKIDNKYGHKVVRNTAKTNGIRKL